ncbi:hypothetical protein MTR67_043929, partial [Solanum verrucosum]
NIPRQRALVRRNVGDNVQPKVFVNPLVEQVSHAEFRVILQVLAQAMNTQANREVVALMKPIVGMEMTRKSPHKVRDCPSQASKSKDGLQVHHNASGSGGAPLHNRFYALQTRHDLESSPNVVIDSETPTLELVPIINKFLKVFPKDLRSILSKREIDFGIDFLPDIQPIYIPPYRMDPSKLKELKDQLKDLLDKGFIRPNISPWGAPVLFV